MNNKQLLNKFNDYWDKLNNALNELLGYKWDMKDLYKYQNVEMIKNTFDTISARELEIIQMHIQNLIELQEDIKEMVLKDKENNKNI